jgi:CRISPR system Cascade subunit CasE
MYLSKLVLDPVHPQTRRDLASAYEMHRTLCRGFVASPEQAPSRFLWRLENGNGNLLGDDAVVLVQSVVAGNWQAVTDSTGYNLRGTKRVDLDRLLSPGASYRFRLVANPTVTRGGRRYGLFREEAQRAWLSRQGERFGFDVRDAVIDGCTRLTVRQGSGGHRITVDVVRFDGVIAAREPIALRRALTDGIGHAKALGLGLLSVARVR